jgi:hypothetical protein
LKEKNARLEGMNEERKDIFFVPFAKIIASVPGIKVEIVPGNRK